MIEIPESRNLELQARKSLIGKKVKNVYSGNSPHKFCWYYDDPKQYDKLLKGKAVIDARGHGMFFDLYFSDMTLSINDGVNIRYHEYLDKHPDKHQLLIEFEDSSYLVFTVAMYGAIMAFPNRQNKNKYYLGSLQSISPLSEQFNKDYFNSIFQRVTKDISAKAFLATEQRIPGLGNGCLHDILISCGIHPKRKISTLSPADKDEMLYVIKAVLTDMAEKGGRNTEKDLFGNYGGYNTILSKNSYKDPCRFCGDTIVKEAYLGGSIYYCPSCQPFDKK